MEENWFNKSIEQTEKELETNIKNGLNKEQVEKAREKYGLNELKAKKRKSLIIKFLEQFKDFMIIILIIAAIISGAAGRSGLRSRCVLLRGYSGIPEISRMGCFPGISPVLDICGAVSGMGRTYVFVVEMD